MQQAGVLFQDGGQSIVTREGALWLFGDTFLGSGDAYGEHKFSGGTGATLALLPRGATAYPPALQYYTGGSAQAVTPFALPADLDPKKHRLWPLHGLELAGKHYRFFSAIEATTGTAPWNFRDLGAGLAVCTTSLGTYHPLSQWRWPLAPAQVLRHGEWIYLYEPGKVQGRPGVVLGRIHPEDFENPSALEFFAGPGRPWSRQRQDAQLLVPEVYGQVSVAWVPALEKWLMVTSSNFFEPNTIQLRTALAPDGPWSDPVAHLSVPERPGAKTKLIYCSYLHPELFSPNAPRVVITYCRMLEGEWALSNPEWVDVDFLQK
jgi:hypothetical protein